MPYVTIRALKDVSTPETKAKLIAGVSNVIANVIAESMGWEKDKVLAHLWCVIEEVEFENWGSGGQQVNSERASGMVKANCGS